ncbi:hypothetical protein ACVWXO_006066 [Bradyrhizobium sp. LM2.7]
MAAFNAASFETSATAREMRRPYADRLFECCCIPAKHRDRGTGTDKTRRNRATYAAAATGHQRVRRMRQSGHALTP